MTDNPDTIEQVTTDDRVLSDGLPDWAETDSATDGSGGDSDTGSWLETVLHDIEPSSPETPESTDSEIDPSVDAGLDLAVCRVVCRNCGEQTVRRVHAECGAPILQIGGTWRCGDCGVEIRPPGECPDCGSPQRREPVSVPLSLELDVRPEELERAIHEATNVRRTDHGLAPLDYSNPLSAIALQHSRDMARRGYFAHSSPEGHEAGDRYRIYGHQALQTGENLAMVTPDRTASLTDAAREVVDGWMDSPDHRENLLRAAYEREGIGVYLNTDGIVYATQNFE